MKPDIFKPYIELREMAGAGMIDIHGGDGSVNDLVYSINSGSPYQSAFNDAMKLAIATQLPLWLTTGDARLLYHPSGRFE